MAEEFTFFYSKKNIFSNFFPCKFSKGGFSFTSSEQCYMYEKAMFFSDFDLSAKILLENNPFKIKKLGYSVKGFETAKWDSVCKTIMIECLLCKFLQNPKLLRKLLQTDGTSLVEASPYDIRWGIGLSESDPRAKSRGSWRGQNWMGECLEKVRDFIQQEENYSLLNYETDIKNELKIQVDVGPYGKYLRLYRGTRWISISAKGWKNILEHHPTIYKNMVDETEFSMVISPNKTLTTRKFKNQMFASVCETFEGRNGEELEKYINFNCCEWVAFEDCITSVNKLLARDVIYKGLDGKWSYIRNNSFSPFRLVKPLTDDDINFFLAAYLIRDEIKRTITAEDLHWPTKVEKHFTSAFRNIDLRSALDTVNSCMKWRIEKGSFMGRLDDLQRMVENPSVRNCNSFKDCDAVMFNTFEALLV